MANKRIYELTENTSPDGSETLLVDAVGYSEAQYIGIDTFAAYVSSSLEDADAIHDDTAAEIYAIAEKTAPDDTDILLIEDGEDSYNKKKLSLANFDLSQCDNSSSNFLTTSDIDFNSLDEKTYLVDGDLFAIEDSEASYNKKKLNASHIPFVTSGSGAPSSTPSKIGDFYVDTSTPNLYYSKGTASSADWVVL